MINPVGVYARLSDRLLLAVPYVAYLLFFSLYSATAFISLFGSLALILSLFFIRQTLRQTPIFFILLFNFLFLVIALNRIYHGNFQLISVSFTEFWKLSLPFFLYLSWPRLKFYTLLKVVFIFATIQAALGVYQHFTGGYPFPPETFGYDPIQPSSINDRLAVGYHATGTTKIHLFFGELMLLAFFPFLCVFLFSDLNKRSKMILGGGLAIVFFGLLFSYARSSWLGLIFGVSALIMIKSRIARIYLPLGALAFLLLVFLNFDFLLSISIDSPLISRVISIFDVSAESNNWQRLYMWQAALAVISDNIWFGAAGLDALSREYQNITLATGHIFDNPPATGVHNMYLQNWVDFGILGFLATLLLLVVTPLFGGYYYLKQKKYFYLPADVVKNKNDENEGKENFTKISGGQLKLNVLLGVSLGILAVAVAAFFENVLTSGMQKAAIYLWIGGIFALVRDLKIASLEITSEKS